MASDPFQHVRACVFDAYGTLFDVRSAVASYRNRLGDRADAFSDLWFRKKVEYTWLRSLMHRYEDFWQITQDALDYAMHALDLDDDTLREGLLDAYLRLEPYPDVRPALRRLKEIGLHTAILSNGTLTMLESAVRHSGLDDVIDDILSADAVGVFKPDPRVYQLAVDRLELEPQQIAFLSTNAWDVAGSAVFGLQVVWLNRFGKHHERLPGQPDAEISSLEALPGLLRGP